jgi:transposase
MILSFSSRYRYFVYRSACDMRKGIDGLSGLVAMEFKQDPLSGNVFVFFNRQRNRIKLLHWEEDGFGVYFKRLEKGTFESPEGSGVSSFEITSEQLRFILDGLVLSSMKKRKRFQHKIVNKKMQNEHTFS